jgi:hypothetical protein
MCATSKKKRCHCWYFKAAIFRFNYNENEICKNVFLIESVKDIKNGVTTFLLYLCLCLQHFMKLFTNDTDVTKKGWTYMNHHFEHGGIPVKYPNLLTSSITVLLQNLNNCIHMKLTAREFWNWKIASYWTSDSPSFFVMVKYPSRAYIIVI